MAAEHQLARVRASFVKQQVMRTIGATLDSVEPGVVTISMPPNPGLTQQRSRRLSICRTRRRPTPHGIESQHRTDTPRG